jgi:hypothetical protein
LKNVSLINKILFGLALILLATGCGLKANPVRSESAASAKQAEQRLSSSVDGNAIVLAWQLKNQTVISYINVEKSQLGSAGNVCKDCPRTFERIGQVPVKKENDEYRFVDSAVEKGRIYSYRLKLCDEAGVCRESQTVEVDYK